MISSGIYEIVCLPTGQRYIGQAIDVQSRLSNHRGRLLRNKHRNHKLQSAFNTCGARSFEFRIVEAGPPGELTRLERKWIALHGARNPQRGFNIRDGIDSSFRGPSQSQEWCRVNWSISEAVRRGLKVAAAQQDTSMEAIADSILGEHLSRRGLLPVEPTHPQPAA